MTEWLLAGTVGLASGVFASMGFGGGFVLVVYFALFTEIAQKNAQGINLMFFIPITVIAVILHIKNKMIDVKTAVICSVIGIPAVIGGFYLTQCIENEYLRKIFAVFIIASGVKDLLGNKSKKNSS